MNRTGVMDKIDIKFADVNSKGYPCYVTKQGTYIAKIGEDYYVLNQYPELGYVGVEGKPMSKVKKGILEHVENF